MIIKCMKIEVLRKLKGKCFEYNNNQRFKIKGKYNLYNENKAIVYLKTF